ncbi:MAG: HipA N-terminal domain-containing protein [Gemmatimonadetes bacterium]|nr:HipA N-terminal domain-containing protein [Gemmatimonadota bacterium]
MTELRVLIGGDFVGIVEQQKSGDLALTYERAWQERDDSYPLSISMPLVQQVHGDPVVRPFMEGLLPDNNSVLDTWAKKFHVSARNPFAVLFQNSNEASSCLSVVMA